MNYKTTTEPAPKTNLEDWTFICHTAAFGMLFYNEKEDKILIKYHNRTKVFSDRLLEFKHIKIPSPIHYKDCIFYEKE